MDRIKRYFTHGFGTGLFFGWNYRGNSTQKRPVMVVRFRGKRLARVVLGKWKSCND